MAKRKSQSTSQESNTENKSQIAEQTVLGGQKVDESLALLFASSAGPVQAPNKARYQEAPPPIRRGKVELVHEDDEEEDDGEEEENADDDGDDEILSSIDGDIEDESVAQSSDEEAEVQADLLESTTNGIKSRKRKHNANADDIEGQYLLKLAKEEEKEEAERIAERQSKRQKLAAEQEDDDSDGSEDVDEDAEASDSESAGGKGKTTPMDLDIPLHESLAPSKEEAEIEKSARTVFLANVSTSAITSKADQKILLEHMGSFLESLPPLQNAKIPHKVESLRFRSTAYTGTALPKKAAFAKKQLMEATTRSTHAYVVYSTAYAAREAVKRLNATVVLDRHLRVDGVAHPAKTDHRRCVFVGNLGYVDDESLMDQSEDMIRKRSKIPSDIEEGLWRQFGKAGAVESVRVVRDEKTRVGKGFAYVQFEDPNSVEAALLFHEKKYPPMLPRILRVTRAKAVKKTALAVQHARQTPSTGSNQQRIYNPKISSQEQSLAGRAGKLLGKAGAAQMKQAAKGAGGKTIPGIAKTPEAIIFEGHRATAGGRPKDLKLGGKAKKGKGKPQKHGSKRSGAWKKAGGKHDVVN